MTYRMYTPMERRQKLKDRGYNEAVIELVEYLPIDEIDHWTDHLLESSDELTIRRQAKCASRPQGHTFTQETYGVCSNCLLKVDPPHPQQFTPLRRRTNVVYSM